MICYVPDWCQLGRDACKLIASAKCTDRDLRPWSESMSAAVTECTQSDEHDDGQWMQCGDMERAIRLGLVAAVAHGDMDLAVELVLAGHSTRVSDEHVEAVAQMTVRDAPPWVTCKLTWPSALVMLALHALLRRELNQARQITILTVLVRVSAVGNLNYAVCYLEQLIDTLREVDPRADLLATTRVAVHDLLTTVVADPMIVAQSE
ncbi:hypothetical protein GGF31_009035 [Allomyces arbusculus]|nr:hypothetical protein GGF31_009035 [Allomyces arbusculus]